MSFQKRKTSYRKGVTSTTLDEYPVPKENEILARISNPRGGNVFEVELPDGQKVLAILPTKFNKLIWMKRGDYVIVTKSEGQFTTSSGKQNGVESMIQHILLKDQVNHIKKEGLWPKEWTQSAAAEEATEKAAKREEEQSDDSDSSDSSFSLEGNPNRRRFYVESDDSEWSVCFKQATKQNRPLWERRQEWRSGLRRSRCSPSCCAASSCTCAETGDRASSSASSPSPSCSSSPSSSRPFPSSSSSSRERPSAPCSGC